MKFIKILPLIYLTYFLSSCTGDPVAPAYVTREITEDHSNIPDPYSRWKAYNLKNYMIEQQMSCFCPDALEIFRIYVRNNEIVDVVRKSDGKSVFNQSFQRFRTVEELFDLVGSINPDSVAQFEVQYDGRFGFPKSIYVDTYSNTADEEYAYNSGGLERFLN